MVHLPVSPGFLSFAAILGGHLLRAAIATAATPVSCATPDNLCTGDPCEIRGVTVISPCVVDFGPRAVVIRGLRVPPGGTLDLKAGSFAVRGRLNGRHGGAGAPAPANVSLTSLGDVTLTNAIDVSGLGAPGSVSIDAGGNMSFGKGGRLLAKGSGSAPGGSVSVHAEGTLQRVSSRGTAPQVDVRGGGAGRRTPGGQIRLDADTGMTIGFPLRANGRDGGDIALASAAGAVTVERIRGTTLNATATTGMGGAISIGAAGAVLVDEFTPASSEDGSGGTISLVGNTVNAFRLDVDGRDTAGAVSVLSSGDVVVGRVRARASTGGNLCITSGHGSVQLEDVNVQGGEVGGTVVLNAAFDVTVGAGPGGGIDADGDPTGGLVRVKAGGNAVLGGGWFARGDGRIDVEAGGDVHVVDPVSAGCVGLRAGGSVFIGATVTPPQVPICAIPGLVCPGTPAFETPTALSITTETAGGICGVLTTDAPGEGVPRRLDPNLASSDPNAICLAAGNPSACCTDFGTGHCNEDTTITCGSSSFGGGGSGVLGPLGEKSESAGRTTRYGLVCTGPTDAVCDIVGDAGNLAMGIGCSTTGCAAGTPIEWPELLKTCAIPTLAADATGSLDRATGAISLSRATVVTFHLLTTTGTTGACPRCRSGTDIADPAVFASGPGSPGIGVCDADAANAGAGCFVFEPAGATEGLSADCVPIAAAVGVASISMALSTSSASASDSNGHFCPGQGGNADCAAAGSPLACCTGPGTGSCGDLDGCFGSGAFAETPATCTGISTAGTPVGPLFIGQPVSARYGGVGCVPAIVSADVLPALASNAIRGLPGPIVVSEKTSWTLE